MHTCLQLSTVFGNGQIILIAAIGARDKKKGSQQDNTGNTVTLFMMLQIVLTGLLFGSFQIASIRDQRSLLRVSVEELRDAFKNLLSWVPSFITAYTITAPIFRNEIPKVLKCISIAIACAVTLCCGLYFPAGSHAFVGPSRRTLGNYSVPHTRSCGTGDAYKGKQALQ